MSSTPSGRSHRLLDKLFTEPGQLPEVARLHHHALREALRTGDLDTIRPAFINFVMVVHALPEWVICGRAANQRWGVIDLRRHFGTTRAIPARQRN